MPAEVKGLSEALRRAKEKIARAPQVMDGLNRNVGDLEKTLAQVESFSAEVQTHTNEVRGLLGGMTQWTASRRRAGKEAAVKLRPWRTGPPIHHP